MRTKYPYTIEQRRPSRVDSKSTLKNLNLCNKKSGLNSIHLLSYYCLETKTTASMRQIHEYPQSILSKYRENYSICHPSNAFFDSSKEGYTLHRLVNVMVLHYFQPLWILKSSRKEVRLHKPKQSFITNHHSEAYMPKCSITIAISAQIVYCLDKYYKARLWKQMRW